MSDDYTKMEGYVADADFGLGCGLPTEFAKIKEGDVVVDLGSGAGNDCFLARAQTGEKGKVIGIDLAVDLEDLDLEQVVGVLELRVHLGARARGQAGDRHAPAGRRPRRRARLRP